MATESQTLAGSSVPKRMDNARSYDEWTQAAREHDERSGAARWREAD